MPIDQQGEQCIKAFKSQGGQSHVTQNPHALLRNNVTAGTIKQLMETGLQLPTGRGHFYDITNRDEDNDEEENDAAVPKTHYSKGKANQLRFVNQVPLVA